MEKLICLMPLFNHVDTLEKAVSSVISQKTSYSFKLIIIDDCSTDGSYELALKLRNDHPNKIEIIRNATNLKLLKSIYNAYNYIIGADYFCVLDPDDWYISNNKYEEAIYFLESNPEYSMYMHNVAVLKGAVYEKFCNTDKTAISFDFDDLMKGKECPSVQTSGVVYRNVYFKNSYNPQYEKIFEFSYPQAFRADGFRFFWYLKAGKCFFNNSVTSVYNFNQFGIWTSLNAFERNIENLKLRISCNEFFNKEEKFFGRISLELFFEVFRKVSSKKEYQNLKKGLRSNIDDVVLKLYQEFSNYKFPLIFIKFYLCKFAICLTIDKKRKKFLKNKKSYYRCLLCINRIYKYL